MIPDFPSFKTLDFTDKPALENFLDKRQQELSDYNFTNLFAWHKARRYSLSRYRRGFLIRVGTAGKYSFMEPMVEDGEAEAAGDCLEYLKNKNSPPQIERVSENFAKKLPKKNFRATAQRDAYDYIYRVSDLLDLKGDEYHSKLNLWNQFNRRHPEYRYRVIGKEIIDDCIDFIHRWCQRRECEKIEGMNWEKCAAIRILRYLPHLETFGGAIEVNGRIEALALGEALNRDTLVIHVEKADERMRGLYQVINRDFLARHGKNFKFVNREEDLGIPGLRKAKKSYRPCHMTRKFRVEPA